MVAVERFKLKSIYECMKRVAVVAVSGRSGADPGFFSGGGALVSCSTSTPINHIVFFFCRITAVLENRRSSQVGVRTPCTLPLDPPLPLVEVPLYYMYQQFQHIKYYFIGFIPSAPFKFMKISAFVSSFSFRSS